MADYGARLDELQAEVLKPQEQDLRLVAEGAVQAQVLARYTGYMAGIVKYIDWRDRALNDAFPLLKEESSSTKGVSQQSRWIEHFAKRGDEAFRTLTDLIKDKDLEKFAPNLKKFAEKVVEQESRFYALLREMPLGFLQGQLQEYTREFRDESKNLEDKWKSLGDQDRSIDQKAADTTQQVMRIMHETVQKVTENQRGIAEKLRNVKIDPNKPITGSTMNALSLILQGGVQYLMTTVEPYRASMQSYTDAFLQQHKMEETIVIVFAQIREAVREFLRKTNLDSAVKEYNDMTRASLDKTAQCPTTRQREDAKKFADKAIEHVRPFMDKFKTEYERFIDQHRGIFVGAVSTKTIEDLLETSQRERSWADVERVNIQRQLQAVFDDSVKTWKIDVNGLSGDDQKALREVWEVELEKLGRGFVAAKDDRIQDQVKAMFKDKLSSLADRVKSSRGGLE
jgi:hypothetical protein